jgi:hypothetical protein
MLIRAALGFDECKGCTRRGEGDVKPSAWRLKAFQAKEGMALSHAKVRKPGVP